MERPRLLTNDAFGFSGVWREVHMDKSCKRPDASRMKARFAAQHAWLKQLPPHRKIVSVSVITEESITMIDAELRRVVDENIKLLTPRTKAAVLVVDATGIKAAVLRSLIAGFTMFTGGTYPTKTETTLEAGFRWLVPHLDSEGGRAPTYDELLAVWRDVAALGTPS